MCASSNTINFKYSKNFKNIFDLYINNSTTDKKVLGSKIVDESMAEFALGQCAMVQNGNWAWSQISQVSGNKVKAENIKYLPIYMGVQGEENQGLCIGTENFFAINSKASSDQITISTFSPFNSFNILAILIPFSPIQEPIASIFSLFEYKVT